MRSIQTAFQQWLKADNKRITWVLILMVVSVGALGLIFAWANSNLPAASATMADGSPDNLSSPFYFLGVFVKLIGVLLLLFGVAYFVRRWKGNASPVQNHKNQMFVVESLRLSPRQALHLVKAGDQVFLVGATDQSLTLVSEVDVTDALAVEMQPAVTEKMMDFGKIFSNKLKQTDSKDAAPVSASTPEI
ncbi:MAG: flagellar biosynthetic protein FliO [Anaerolineaceae bacterium]|nr:flagellar biosynthetic protein FliO [Anaerolineaceae bacterium]